MRFLLSLLFFSFAFSQIITNIRLVDHTSYIVELIQITVDRLQKNHWNSLKVHDVTIEIDQEILNKTVQGTVSLSNGFIVSIQHLTLIPSTIQQAWLYARDTNTTSLELRSTMEMTNIVIGFDIHGTINGVKYHNTGTMLYPSIQFRFVLVRNLFTDELSSRAEPVLLRTTNRMQFLPSDEFSQVLGHLNRKIATYPQYGCQLLTLKLRSNWLVLSKRILKDNTQYDWNSISPTLQTWAKEVFAPIILDVAETEHPIPVFCYDCSI